MPIDIFLIFYHDILAMILYRILTKIKGTCAFFLATEQKPGNFHNKPRYRQFRRRENNKRYSAK